MPEMVLRVLHDARKLQRVQNTTQPCLGFDPELTTGSACCTLLCGCLICCPQSESRLCAIVCQWVLLASPPYEGRVRSSSALCTQRADHVQQQSVPCRFLARRVSASTPQFLVLERPHVCKTLEYDISAGPVALPVRCNPCQDSALSVADRFVFSGSSVVYKPFPLRLLANIPG